MRPLEPIEQQVASALIELARVREWEFSAALDLKEGKVVEFCTSMVRDGSDFAESVNNRARSNPQSITVHHNHLSKESLSWPDWNGLIEMRFKETFAHCDDGTTYWGRVIQENDVKNCFAKRSETDDLANRLLCEQFVGKVKNRQDEVWVTSFYIKHVVATAMSRKGYVKYDVHWGSHLRTPWKRYGEGLAKVSTLLSNSL